MHGQDDPPWFPMPLFSRSAACSQIKPVPVPRKLEIAENLGRKDLNRIALYASLLWHFRHNETVLHRAPVLAC
jgi:hypothetical protein